jgi:hypothetical protein
MRIEKTRVLNLDRNLAPVPKGTEVVVALEDVQRFEDTLVQAGFTKELEVGEQVLPTSDFGPVSRYNALGKHLVHRDQPMETAYRVSEWHWKEWHGKDRIERSKLVDVPYQRYPRTFFDPPSIELQVVASPNEQKVIAAPAIIYTDENEDRLKHTINLYLEMFRECTIFTAELKHIVRASVKRLNWTILPPGKWPWQKLRKHVEPIVKRAPRGKQSVIWRRLEVMNSYEPEFRAVGRGGFTGYIIFGFPDRNLFICESVHVDNATYVFDERWEELSKMTKAQILNQDLQKERIIHRSKWEQHIEQLFSD